MQVYIEKEFFDNFYLEYDEKSLTSSQKIVSDIITLYTDIHWFIDFKPDSLEQAKILENENPFFRDIADGASINGIRSIKEHFFDKTICKQTLVFTQNEEDWFLEAEKKGALCFSYDSYQSKIQSIITNCHTKIDLSNHFQGWDGFSLVNILPFNQLVVNDSYILVNEGNQKMEDNIIKLLESLLSKKENDTIDIQIFTDVIIKEKSYKEKLTDGQIKVAATKKLGKLNSSFANFNTRFQIISNSIFKRNYNMAYEERIDFHDRLIYSNYLIIDCPKGFNLIPHRNSNSQIIIETIFDKYTYNRLKNHQKLQEDYLKKLNLELKRKNTKFIMCPINSYD